MDGCKLGDLGDLNACEEKIGNPGRVFPGFPGQPWEDVPLYQHCVDEGDATVVPRHILHTPS